MTNKRVSKYRYELASASDRGKIRENNEDSIANIRVDANFGGKPSSLDMLVVADGVGGGPSGERASKIAVTSFISRLAETLPIRSGAELRTAIDDVFQAVNRDVVEASKEMPHDNGMATTLTVAIVHESKCYVGHVGDSRCYRLRKGELERRTTDQAIGRVLQEVIGADRKPSVLLDEFDLKEGDSVLVCSDGLYKTIDDETIELIVSSGEDVRKTCEDLVEAANNAGGDDNISVGLLRVTR